MAEEKEKATNGDGITQPSSKRMKLREKWGQIIREQEQSGQTQVAFCREQRLSVSTFGYWKNKLAHEQRSMQLVRLPGEVSFIGGNFVSPNRPVSPALNVWVGEYRVDVSDEFKPRTLSVLVQTLRRI